MAGCGPDVVLLVPQDPAWRFEPAELVTPAEGCEADDVRLVGWGRLVGLAWEGEAPEAPDPGVPSVRALDVRGEAVFTFTLCATAPPTRGFAVAWGSDGQEAWLRIDEEATW